MESSRIFVKGLPPTILEEEFRKHFSTKYAITDAKLIPHRRIGYVGYKSPEEATKAVKYFNRSFIRMSKIGVELAKPISDTSLPISRKSQREHAKVVQRSEREAGVLKQTSPLKRKRSEFDESDPKLKEFLEVMQSKSKSKSLIKPVLDNGSFQRPPAKVQALQLPEIDGDSEYEMVPKKSKKESIPPKPLVPPTKPVIIDAQAATNALEEKEENAPESTNTHRPIGGLETTDDDWLRSRTNRVLDLVDPKDTTTVEDPKEGGSYDDVPENENLHTMILNAAHEENTTVEPNAAAAHDEENEAKTEDPVITAIKANGRLFVRNLPYSASEDDLRQHFEPYGNLEEVHLPVDQVGRSKGFVLVQYSNPESAIEAFHNIDGEPFQGRLLHVLPAASKRETKLDHFAIAKLPLKKQKQIKKKAEASTITFNWNSLYMNQDAVNTSVAEKLGISKSELLDPTSADAGVKQAIAETYIIQDTKSYFLKNGVDLNAFKKRERGDTTILVKNFPYGMSLGELRAMFEEFGQVLRVLMPPTGTIAIVEFSQAPQARAAFASLAYRRIKESVLFLEKAPKGIFTQAITGDSTIMFTNPGAAAVDPKLSSTELLGLDGLQTSGDTSTLFVRNLSFNTTSDGLAKIFKPLDGFLSARVNTKTDPKKPGQVLSMGFGFLEFRSKSQGRAAIATMDGFALDGHKLSIKASHKGLDAAEERKAADRAKKVAGRRTKIIIKNLPFEASKKDVRALFGTYGQLRSVRVPKKIDNSARGFAFADFTTAREAENALESLKDTHLLGRRLALEFAAEDAVDPEEEIEKMQKKIGKQVSKIAMQKLTGGGRKKFNIAGNDSDDE